MSEELNALLPGNDPVTCDCTPAKTIYGANRYTDFIDEDPTDYRTRVYPSEFENDQTISYFSFPYCQEIGEKGFKNSTIEEIVIPRCRVIGEQAFNQSTISRGDFQSVTDIGANAFHNCGWEWGSSLYFPNIENIGNDAFGYGAHGPTNVTIDIRNVKTIGDSAFYQSRFIFYDNKFILPYCTHIGNHAFNTYYENGHTVTEISLPSIITIGDSGMRDVHLTSGGGDITIGPNCTSIGTYCFTGTFASHNLIIEATTPPTLGGVLNVDGYTPQHIYVPAASVSAYQSATNWSRYASIISAFPT